MRDEQLMDMARLVARTSTDRSTGVGCVLVSDGEVVATGVNGFPRGAQDTEARHERPAKYLWTEHAERNAVYSAARRGASLLGCTAWFPCMDCARALVQVGVVRLVGRPWAAEHAAALELLGEAGVELTWLDGPNGEKR